MRKSSLRLFAVVCLAWVAGKTGPADGATAVPVNPEDVKARVAELRREYEPYLRSLPGALAVRRKTPLRGQWRTKFEIRQAKDNTRPEPPAWFRADFDDSGWEQTTVPEWRYAGKNRVPVSCILWYRTQFAADAVKPGQRVFLVFGGVDWEAEVWLNGKRLGNHKGYYEPFRFEVADVLKETNTLAVRVIDGPKFGEPRAYWTLFPVVPAKEQRYVRQRAKSLRGLGKSDLHIGSGFGIHREVFLETTGEACVTGIFARGEPQQQSSTVIIETDAAKARQITLDVQILPENFEGKSYRVSVKCDLPQGLGRQTVAVPMPGAKLWSPATPYLYRCRASISDGGGQMDAKEALFGCRSFDIVSKQRPRDGLPEGMFLLNGRPLYLRGTNIQGLNALWYWNEQDKLLDTLLLLKAANFNAVRSCQHVCYPEVRELLDRLGIMSEQDQGSGAPPGNTPEQLSQLPSTGTALARVCYNNPGVVLLSFGNETTFDPTKVIEAVLAVDAERILVPISGPLVTLKSGDDYPAKYPIPRAYWENVSNSLHTYAGWYGDVGKLWSLAHVRKPGRLITVGEYGGEALDSYETMKRYPASFGELPSLDADELFGQTQVTKSDAKQIVGFRGKRPANLGQYIEASQNYQADLLAEASKGLRLSARTIAGYFQFHFIDVTPADWPKSIVSHDLSPKKGYFEMAQVNQPLVPLFQLLDRGKTMELWIANDRPERLEDCRLQWNVASGGKTLVGGEKVVDVPAANAVSVANADLSSIPQDADMITIELILSDAAGTRLSSYQREVWLKLWRDREPPSKHGP